MTDDARPLCTRYIAGQGRHHLQLSCPLAPRVACSPESPPSQALEEYCRDREDRDAEAE